MDVWTLVGFAVLAAIILAGFSRFVRRITVFEYQHALRFVRGKSAGVLSPGPHWVFHPLTSVRFLEARPHVINIPGQEVLSADGVSLKVSLLLNVRIADPTAATLGAASYQETLYASAQAALRPAVGAKPMEEVLQERADLSSRIQSEVAPVAQELGLELRSISIKDIMFPGTLKEAFSQAARAKQEAQATLERARGETAALRNLANAARMLEGNPHLFQLRVLQAVSEAGKVVLTVAPPDSEASNERPEPTA